MRRMRRSLIAILAGLSSLSVFAQQSAPRFSAESNFVIVPTVVMDKNGAPISGLTQSDFQLFEDGKPVPIETFVAANAPGAAIGNRFIVLVLDNVNTAPEIAYRFGGGGLAQGREVVRRHDPGRGRRGDRSLPTGIR
jgi:hypothetical protein